jgi:hypothetical protein
MKKQTQFSIWLILNLTRIAFWLLISGIILYSALWIGSYLNSDQLSLNVPLSFHFDLPEKGIVNLSGSAFEVELGKSIGQFHFNNLPQSLYMYLLLCILPVFCGLVYLLWLLKKFLYNVHIGKVFTMENAIGLKKISILILLGWAYNMIGTIIFYYIFIEKMVFKQVKFGLHIDFYGSTLFFGLFFLVLSLIFQKGIELDEENRLTI